MVTFLMTFTDP